MLPVFHRAITRAAAVGAAALFVTGGCSKKADTTSNYTSAIDAYYAKQPACLWSDEVKFPLQVATADADKTKPYDALVDQGLLVRTSVEKKKLIVLSQQANNYDLSDKGRSAWTADTAQPGFGNFCYGHRKVSNVLSSTPANGQPGATTQVAYQYTLADAPGWATAPETQTAFPQLRAELAGPQPAQAVLVNTAQGWQVSSAPDAPKHPQPVSAADGKVVQ